MALQHARTSQAVSCLTLRQIPTLPTTEDLLYVLATATKNKKPTELPFTNPYNGFNFKIRVVPASLQLAPRWTFERCDHSGSRFLWTRETNEVIMIQGKIKIEANYTCSPSDQMLDAEIDSASGSQPIILGSSVISANYLPAMSQSQEHHSALEDTTLVDVPSAAASTWLFSGKCSGPVAMPQAVPLNRDVVKNYIGALTNPASNLLRPSAFEFFLLRDLEYVHKYGGKLSLLVFDFATAPESDCAHGANKVAATIAAALNSSCTALEMCTQLRSGEFAVLLCGYDGEKALLFAQLICEKLADNGECPDEKCDHLESLAIGAACIPETCKDPGVLIAAASKAKTLARQSCRKYMLFPLF